MIKIIRPEIVEDDRVLIGITGGSAPAVVFFDTQMFPVELKIESKGRTKSLKAT